MIYQYGSDYLKPIYPKLMLCYCYLIRIYYQYIYLLCKPKDQIFPFHRQLTI